MNEDGCYRYDATFHERSLLLHVCEHGICPYMSEYAGYQILLQGPLYLWLKNVLAKYPWRY